MKVLITGGAGFLGGRLAKSLLRQQQILGEPIEQLVIADLFAPKESLSNDVRVVSRTGNLVDLCAAFSQDRFDICFHMASALSGECESNFDTGMRSNIDTTRTLLESLRAAGNCPRIIFASSVAVFGSDPYLGMPAIIDDATLPTPQSSYGTQKFICEQLIAEYTRRGFVDGRAARLMTVVVRPGRPNSAASSFLSSIIREPMHGEVAVCPVPPESAVAIASPARTIEGLVAVAEAERDSFGGRTALNLPALTVRVSEMLQALEEVGGKKALDCVRFAADPAVAKIVRGWPSAFKSTRAERLRLKPDLDFLTIIRQFVEDEREEQVDGRVSFT